jgi:drug/metabolite transporter (DMT)-like permease
MLTGIGVLVLTPDSLLVRLIVADPATILFWRGVFAALALGGFFALRDRRGFVAAFRRTGLMGLVAGALFAASTILFILAILTTTVANTLVVVAVAPLIAAVLSRTLLGERVGGHTWVAVGGGFAGVAVIFADGLASASGPGLLYAFGAACCMAGQLVAVRRARAVNMVPSLVYGSVLTALAALPFAAPLAIDARAMMLLALLGLVVIPLAFALITLGPRYLPAPEVGLLMLLETVIGPFWVWLALGETPANATFFGGALVIATLAGHSAWALHLSVNR